METITGSNLANSYLSVEVTPGRRGFFVSYLGEGKGPTVGKCLGPYYVNIEAGHEYFWTTEMELEKKEYSKSYYHYYHTVQDENGLKTILNIDSK